MFLVLIFAGRQVGAQDSWRIQLAEEFASPVTTDARQTLYWGGGAVMLSLIFNNAVSEPLESYSAKERPLGDFSAIGDLMGRMVPNAIYVLGMGADAYWNDDSDGSSAQNAFLMVKATAYAGAVTTILKYTVREKRPARDSRNSFPSGHTTTAFAFSSVVGELHGWRWGIPAYLLAAFVGYSRINDQQHYLRDVLAGATIGMGYGIGLSRLASRKSKEEKVVVTPLLLPAGGVGMMATLLF